MEKVKYSYEDRVQFKVGDQIKEGSIYIIDANGTFKNPNKVSYDIMVDAENTLYKHILQTSIINE